MKSHDEIAELQYGADPSQPFGSEWFPELRVFWLGQLILIVSGMGALTVIVFVALFGFGAWLLYGARNLIRLGVCELQVAEHGGHDHCFSGQLVRHRWD